MAEEEEVVVITVLTTLLVDLTKPVDVVAVEAELVQENDALDGESDPTGRVADISGPEVSLVNQQLEQDQRKERFDTHDDGDEMLAGPDFPND